MSDKCALCGREAVKTSAVHFQTAQVVGSSSTRDYNSTTTTTAYSLFQEHTYALCGWCRFWYRWQGLVTVFVVPAIWFGIFYLVSEGHLSSGRQWLIMGTLSIAALVILNYYRITTREKLMKIAEKSRKYGERTEFRAFSNKQVESLKHSSQAGAWF